MFKFLVPFILSTSLSAATLNVSSYGAKPGDSAEDTAAVQAAVNAAKSGDTVFFDGEGIYILKKVVIAKSWLTVTGNSKAILQGASGTDNRAALYLDKASDLVIKGLHFQQRAINIQGSARVTIQDNWHQFLNASGGDSHAIFANGLTDSVIERNEFKDNTFDTSILLNNIAGVKIRRNVFTNVHEAIHCTSWVPSAKGVEVSYNVMTKVGRMGIEMQESPDHTFPGYDGLLIEGNWFNDPQVGDKESFSYSIVPDLATNTIVRNNYSGSPSSTYQKGIVYGFEVTQAMVTGNRTDRAHVGFVSYNNHNMRQATVTGNQIYGAEVAYQNVNASNNTISSTVPPIPAPPAAGPNSNVTPPIPVPAPPVVVIPKPTSLPTPVCEAEPILYASDLTYVSILNAWGQVEKDLSNGEQVAKDGKPLTIQGEKFTKGFGVHAMSEIRVPLLCRYKTFSASIGIDDEVGDKGSVIFLVYGDGKLLYQSLVKTGAMPAEKISVNVNGVSTLSLLAWETADGNAFDHADWADAQILK